MCAVRRRSPPAPKPIRQRICVHEAEPFEGETGLRRRGRIDDVIQRNRRTIGAALAMCSSTPIVAREASFEIERRPAASATLDFYVSDGPFGADRIASATPRPHHQARNANAARRLTNWNLRTRPIGNESENHFEIEGSTAQHLPCDDNGNEARTSTTPSSVHEAELLAQWSSRRLTGG